MTIELDPRLSPQQNLERLFRQYKKAKAARYALADRAERLRVRMERLKEAEAKAEAAKGLEEIEAAAKLLKALGLLAGAHVAQARAEPTSGPRIFRSAEGLEILVARNQRQNDQLTFQIARGNDYWLHVLGWPGPHVVIRKPPDKSVSQETLLDAAHLAINFSRLRGADYAEVVYTQRKHVSRARGAPAGHVNYANAKRLQVRIEPERLRRLLTQATGPAADESCGVVEPPG